MTATPSRTSVGTTAGASSSGRGATRSTSGGGGPTDPRRRVIRSLIWALVAIAVVALVVLVARWIRATPAGADFIATYPGTVALPDGAPVGIPAWLGWLHFLNALLMLLIVRTGWLMHRGGRPPGSWTRRNTGVLRTKRAPRRMSLHLWFHLSLDVLWVTVGVLYVVLLFATGQWLRLVPTDWAAVPNALSVALQYASLEWPVEDSWVAYNALQQFAYAGAVFIAAPLAILSGVRMSPAWPADGPLARAVPIGLARAVHYPVMLVFVAFVIVHVVLVFTTGALRNLNHMYAARDADDWVGFAIFALSAGVMAGAWALARPVFLRPIAALTGTVQKQ